MTTALLKKPERDTLEEILQRPAYAERFKQVLGEKSSQFCSSLVSIGRTMPDVDPKSIVGSAMIAACLDLPIERNLGFAWIVPYKKGEQKYAQFQMGYKGYVQLAQRTGYYAGMNACTINKEGYKGRDNLGEPIIDWDQVDETKPAVGYFFGFKMINGFVKGCYWTKEKVIAHAKQYSQSYRSGYDSPWKSHFDKMALKTLIANELSDWGILSIQFQLARKSDQALVRDIDAEAEYIDTTSPGQITDGEHKPTPTAHQQATQSVPGTTIQTPATGTEPPKLEVKPAKSAEPEDNVSFETAKASALPQAASEPQSATSTPLEAQKQPEPTPVSAEAPPSGTPEPFSPDPAFAPKEGDSDAVASLKVVAAKLPITHAQLMAYLLQKKLKRENQTQLSELSEKKLLDISKHLPSWVPEIKEVK